MLFTNLALIVFFSWVLFWLSTQENFLSQIGEQYDFLFNAMEICGSAIILSEDKNSENKLPIIGY